jgi:hypothetical protein
MIMPPCLQCLAFIPTSNYRMMNGQDMKRTKINALSGNWVQDGEEGWSKIGSKAHRGLKGRQRAIPFLHHGPHTIQKVIPSG